MANKKIKVLVVGSGWYGCHASSLLLESNCDVTIVDNSNDFFVGSSLKNQNRLHIGFHYPRSESTRNESECGYKKFMSTYGNFAQEISSNIYCVAKNSILDYRTYLKIMADKSNYFSEIENKEYLRQNFSFNSDLIDGAIKTEEKLLLTDNIKEFFKAKLTSKMIPYCDEKITNLEKENDFVLDCTFGQKHNFGNFNYELSICLLYKSSMKDFAITVMDGPFFSIFPFDIDKRLYTLTHVSHTPLFTSCSIKEIYKRKEMFCVDELNSIIKKMEKEVIPYINNFNDIFEYYGFYVAIKTKSNEKSDNRSLFFNICDKKLSFVGGKITGIFAMEDIIKKHIINNI